ncbi:hydrogenase maturation nickel metallochaperone HypA [Aliiroseovarius subalbicans]|uniref:hydrogenase maturation nickel metallochaperone HypA n=1 Tax=Aliiroseovarius subalbicans TaxID=2925840 RepID=UPI001F568BF5|nr:hydrogenase maturation nickel metallochaperone HypA [Aliiroseovarius subalbicans]MCI2397813.1 hydrogenase maturation nickel metallochaperone HypA [Aliiroseovarius subalbicans]
MHEMALAESVVQIVEAAAAREGAGCVKRVRLEIGALSHADANALRFAFDAAAAGGVAKGAELAISRAEGRAWCHDCAKDVAISGLGDPCPDCGGYDLKLTAGDALRVVDMEVT